MTEYIGWEMTCKDCVHFKNKADVVEVVRCKDCRYKHYMIGNTYGYCIKHNTHMYDDDFCSYGEKMDEGKGDF